MRRQLLPAFGLVEQGGQRLEAGVVRAKCLSDAPPGVDRQSGVAALLVVQPSHVHAVAIGSVTVGSERRATFQRRYQLVPALGHFERLAQPVQRFEVAVVPGQAGVPRADRPLGVTDVHRDARRLAQRAAP
jgi:hypothetical protein